MSRPRLETPYKPRYNSLSGRSRRRDSIKVAQYTCTSRTSTAGARSKVERWGPRSSASSKLSLKSRFRKMQGNGS
jgi:hypothetical protein